METIQDKIDKVSGLISPEAALAAKGLLDAYRIKQLTKHDLLAAVLTIRAKSIKDNADRRLNTTPSVDNLQIRIS